MNACRFHHFEVKCWSGVGPRVLLWLLRRTNFELHYGTAFCDIFR